MLCDLSGNPFPRQLSHSEKNVIPCVEGTPIHDIMEMIAYCKAKGTRLLGPGSIGIITPGEAVVGWLGGNVEWANTFFKRGSIGVFARSGLASRQGLRPANCVGVIDADYRDGAQ